MKKLMFTLIIILQGVAMCMASDDHSTDEFEVNYKLMFGRDVQNVFGVTNAPFAGDSRENWDVYVVGSIVEKKRMVRGGRPSVKITFSSLRQKTIKGTSPACWVSAVKPFFFLVRLGSYRGELADLDVHYEVSVVMRK